MDSPLLSSVVLALGLLLTFFQLLVESQGNNNYNNHVSQSHNVPPRAPHNHHLAPPPHPRKRPYRSSTNQPTKGHRRREKHKKQTQNLGKKVGLCFLGVAAVLQVCVVGFLVFKRRQLFKDQDSLS